MVGLVFRLGPHVIKNFRFLPRSYLLVRPSIFTLPSMSESTLNPPTSVKGMTKLNRLLFSKTVDVPCLLLPVASLNKSKNIIRDYLLKLQNFRPIQEFKGADSVLSTPDVNISAACKIAVINPSVVSSFDDFKSEHRDGLLSLEITEKNLITSQLTMRYENWKADEILRAIIPESFDSVSGYSMCGHIVHLNLREHLSDFKEVIAEVLLDKVACARTVVNKTDSIDSTFRTFNMEVLCGDDDLIATVQENRCKFTFDFSKVYWNSRLGSEHDRVVSKLKKGDLVYDVFCGVGPFSIPASKKGCRVLANDLNPESIKWFHESAKLNKVRCEVYNQDGAQFIKQVIKDDLLKQEDLAGEIHVIMNLPALAPTFLPCFKDLFSDSEMETISKLPVPKVYVFCFTKGSEDFKAAARKMVEEQLNMDLTEEIFDVSFVRNVAPLKEMMRVMKPKKNPFKVNHVRSIKLKNKAKAYVGKLKNLSELSRQKVEAVDSQLKELQDLVYQPPKPSTAPVKQTIDKKEKQNENLKATKDFQISEKNEKEALSKLDNMEL